MKSRLFKYEIPQDLSDRAVADALAKLPPWRLEKALSYKRSIDRFLCAEAYLLLKDALSECFGIDGEFSFGYAPSGKPFLNEYPEIHFNLSHCSSCVCCAVSSSPVGVDVENIQYDPDLAGTVFNTSEQEAIESADNREIEFTKLWTMKESFLKLTGEGIVDNIKEVLTKEDPVFELEINVGRGYVLCTARTA